MWYKLGMQMMKRSTNVLLLRAGFTNREKIHHPIHYPPPLSLKYVEAFLKNEGGYDVRIVDRFIDSSPSAFLMNDISSWPADIVIVSIASSAEEEGIRLCRAIKKQKNGTFVIGVGSDISEKYKDYLALDSLFDVIIRGEFELEVCSLLKRLDLSDPAGVVRIKEEYNMHKIKELFLVENLDDLPPIRWSRAELERYPIFYPLRVRQRIISGYVSTSRGCPHGCTFCSPTIRKSYGKKMRLRSAVKVADELEALQGLGVNAVTFEDDDFTVVKEHVVAVCAEIIRRKLSVKWVCHARIDEVNPDLLSVMYKAGCALLLFGVESGSQDVIKTLYKTTSKEDWYERTKVAFQESRRAGIGTCAMFMVGNPAETEADYQRSIDLALEIKPDLIKVHNFNLYPGSADYFKYKKRDKEDFTQHHYMQPRLNISRMEDRALKKAQRRFYRKFMFRPSFILSHLREYSLFYINNWSSSSRLIKKGLVFLLLSDNSVSGKSAPRNYSPADPSRISVGSI